MLSDSNKKLNYDRKRNIESDDFEDLEFPRRPGSGNPDYGYSFKEGGRHFYYKDVR